VADLRVSQLLTQTLAAPDAGLSESQLLVETIAAPAAGLSTSQLLVETLARSGVPLVVSQLRVETLTVQIPASDTGASSGGEIGDLSDPVNDVPQGARSIALMRWVEIGFDDGPRSFSPVPFCTPSGRAIGVPLSFGAITYRLSDRKGAYQMATASVQIPDESRLLATLEAAGGSEHWLNRDARILIADPAVLAAGGAPTVVFRGIWTGFDTDAFTPTLTFTSRLASLMSDLALERQVPSRTFRNDFADRQTSIVTESGARPPLDTATLDQVVPIAYGRISDTAIVIAEGRPTDHRRGRIKPVYVGIAVGLDGLERHEFVIGGSAITGVLEAFIDDRQIDLTTGEVLVVSTPGWTSAISATAWVTYGGRRYATCYMGLNEATDAVIRGESLLTLNVDGIEDVGDATGATVRRAPRVVYHLLNQWALGDYQAGNWAAAAAFDDGTPILNHQTFRECEAWEYPQVGGEGYELGIYLDAPMSLRQLLERFAIEAGLYFAENMVGQLCAFHIPTLEDLATVETITTRLEIQRGTQIARPADLIENDIRFDWDYRQADQSYGHVGDRWDARVPPAGWAPEPSALDATNGRLQRGDDRQLRWVHSGVQVTTLAAWSLALGKRVPRVVTMTGPLAWIRLQVGRLIRVTDEQGIGAQGWTDRPMWILSLSINLGTDESAPSVVLQCLDMAAFYVGLGG